MQTAAQSTAEGEDYADKPLRMPVEARSGDNETQETDLPAHVPLAGTEAPFLLPFDTPLAYRPYRGWPAAQPEPYRLVQRMTIERADGVMLRRYTIEPWQRLGDWWHDRPVSVLAEQVSLWEGDIHA